MSANGTKQNSTEFLCWAGQQTQTPRQLPKAEEYREAAMKRISSVPVQARVLRTTTEAAEKKRTLAWNALGLATKAADGSPEATAAVGWLANLHRKLEAAYVKAAAEETAFRKANGLGDGYGYAYREME